MNRRTVIALTTAALMLSGTVGLAQDDKQSTPPMHMHKSEMNHRKDTDVSKEFKSEATQLREQAESHRKLAQAYRTRTPLKAGTSYENVAQHCDQLAKYYENAAKEAEAVATELSKQVE